MLRRPLLALPVALIAAGLLAAPASPAAGVQRQLVAAQELEDALLVEVNALRRRYGLSALRRSPRLAVAATAHSRSMATLGYFAHTSPNGAAFWRRVQRFYVSDGYRYWAAGENLLWAAPSLEANKALQMWLESPPHRRNLLSRTWREVGFAAVHAEDAPGTFAGRDVVVVTANFGVRR